MLSRSPADTSLLPPATTQRTSRWGSSREPLFRLGLGSNRLMIAWGAATLAVLLVATSVPGVRSAFKVTGLNAHEWTLVVGAALVGTFWIEVRKLLTFHRHAVSSPAHAPGA